MPSREDGLFAQIDDYLAGGLSAAERATFENAMRHDQGLAEEVRLRQGVRSAVTDYGAQGLARNLAAVSQAWQAQHPPKPWWRQARAQRMAAAFLMLLGVGIGAYFGYFRPPSSPAALYSQYYQPFPHENIRGTASVRDSLMQGAMQAYAQKRHAEAKAMLLAIIDKTPHYIKARFYLGHCALGLSETRLAIAQFEKVVSHADNIYVGWAGWYLVLAHLQNDDVARAKALLYQPQVALPDDSAAAALRAALEGY